MATFKKLESGKFQAQVAVNGVRTSRSFRLKSDAKSWADDTEYSLRHGAAKVSDQRLWNIFDKYAREHSPKKRGAKWEIIRLEKFKRDPVSQTKVSDLTPKVFADWRDAQLQVLSAGSVNREMVLMSAALTVARREWGWIAINPLSDVRKPTKPRPRNRLVSEAELAELITSGGGDLTKVRGRVVHAFLFAIETGMRSGEIVGLKWDDIDIERRFLMLHLTKNGSSRGVPLSGRAIELLQELPVGDPVFGLTDAVRDTVFRDVRDKAGIKDLTFHDSRHEAITRLAKKMDVLALARTVGHNDIRQLQVYYNETAEDLAKLLD